jgi:uncharacterized protein YmfQ (DUF2313 family)
MYSVAELTEQFLNLAKKLYPTGRAFKMAEGSVFESLNRALSKSEARFQADANSILDSLIPDNNNFTADDASDWERRLGLITNESVSLADRKAAILRKMKFPGVVKARESYRWLQKQLNDAGFVCTVVENRFSSGSGVYYSVDPITYNGGGGTTNEHGVFQHGDAEHGDYWQNIVANHIDEERDFPFNVGEELYDTFFISGNVDAGRKDEFRQLILKTKPAQAVGFLFVNYV